MLNKYALNHRYYNTQHEVDSIEDKFFLGDRLAPLLDQAWEHLEVHDYITLEREAAYMSSCARVLRHWFLADVSGMLALAAGYRDQERCELFLAVMQWESGGRAAGEAESV